MWFKILFTIIILTVVGCFLWFGFLWKIAKSNIAGSYTHAETWCLKVKEKDLILALNELKKQHPELEPPNTSYPTFEKNNNGYDFEFYYNDTNENVQVFIRRNNDSLYTTMAFIAVYSHIDTLTSTSNFKSYRKEINSDMGYFENRAQIKKFEQKILLPLKEKI